MENTNTTVKQTYDYTKTDLEKMGNWKIKFGKHKGKTFGELLRNHPDYCEWIVSKFDGDDALVQFINRSELDFRNSPEIPPVELYAGC